MQHMLRQRKLKILILERYLKMLLLQSFTIKGIRVEIFQKPVQVKIKLLLDLDGNIYNPKIC